MPSVKELKANLSKHGLATSGLKSVLEARWEKYVAGALVEKRQQQKRQQQKKVFALQERRSTVSRPVIDQTEGVPASKRRRRDGDNGAAAVPAAAEAAAAKPAAAEAPAAEPTAAEAAAAEAAAVSLKDGVFEFPTVVVTSHGETSVIDGELHEGDVKFKILDGSRAGETVDEGHTFNEFVNEHTVLIATEDCYGREKWQPRVSQNAEFFHRYPTVPPLSIVEGPTRVSSADCHGSGYDAFPIGEGSSAKPFWTIWATRCDQNPNDKWDLDSFRFPDDTPDDGPEDYIIVEIPARPGHPVVALEVAGLFSEANLNEPLPADFAEFDLGAREEYYREVADMAKEASELRVQEVFEKPPAVHGDVSDPRVFEDGKTLVEWGAYGTGHAFGGGQDEGWLDSQYTPALIQVSTDATIFKISLRGSNWMFRGCAMFRCIQDDANPPVSHAEPNRQRLQPKNFTAFTVAIRNLVTSPSTVETFVLFHFL